MLLVMNGGRVSPTCLLTGMNSQNTLKQDLPLSSLHESLLWFTFNCLHYSIILRTQFECPTDCFYSRLSEKTLICSFEVNASRIKAAIFFRMFCMEFCIGTFAGFAYVNVLICIRAETSHSL